MFVVWRYVEWIRNAGDKWPESQFDVETFILIPIVICEKEREREMKMVYNYIIHKYLPSWNQSYKTWIRSEFVNISLNIIAFKPKPSSMSCDLNRITLVCECSSTLLPFRKSIAYEMSRDEEKNIDDCIPWVWRCRNADTHNWHTLTHNQASHKLVD